MGPKLRKYLQEHYRLPEGASDDTANRVMADRIADGSLSPDKMKELADADGSTVKSQVKQMIDDAVQKAVGTTKSHNQGALNRIMAGENTDTKDVNIRVKDPSERYCRQKSMGKHKTTGEPVQLEGSPVYTPSEKEYAEVGVWFKSLLRKNASEVSKSSVDVPTISEHEDELLREMRSKGRWSGEMHGDRQVNAMTLGDIFNKQGADDMTLKALLDDATSGGENLIPDAFDSGALVTYPLLHSELLPLVDIRSTNRQTVLSGSMNNPTVAWGGSDSSVSLFTTTSMVSQISTPVYDVMGAIEMGKDWLADSAVEIGAKLTEAYGQRFAEEYDNVICNGVDGSSEPEGILQSSGTNTVNSENGSTGPWEVSDLEALLFGVAKQYRLSALNPCYLSNDVTYSRLRGIEVGTSDQRRVLGMTHEDYKTLGRPHKINGEAGNQTCAFGCLKKYSFWRRSGVSIDFVTGGKTLALANTMLIVARARCGGQVMDPNAFAVISDGQS